MWFFRANLQEQGVSTHPWTAVNGTGRTEAIPMQAGNLTQVCADTLCHHAVSQTDPSSSARHPLNRTAEFNKAPKSILHISVLKYIFTSLSSMKLQVTGNQDSSNKNMLNH